MVLRKSQIKEWAEGTVVDILKIVLEKELEEAYKARAVLFHPGEPMRTQEERSYIIGKEGVLQDLLDILNVDDKHGTLTSYFEGNDVTIINDEEVS